MPAIDISSVDFSGLVTSITDLVPILLVPVVALAGIRKGISFIKNMVRGA